MTETHPKKYCMIKTEIIEALAGTWLCSYEAQILFAIIRKTYGWELSDGSRKTEDWISYSQLKEITGIRHDSHLSRTIASLLMRSIVTKGGNKIGINKNVDSWLKLKEELPKGVRSHHLLKGVTKKDSQPQELPKGVSNIKSYQRGYEELPKGADTKEINTKEKSIRGKVLTCDKQQLWEIAVKLHVSQGDVEDTYKSVLESIENGDKYDVKNVPLTVSTWIRRGISKGDIEKISDLEYMALLHDTPEYFKNRDETIKKMQDQEEKEYAERHKTA